MPPPVAATPYIIQLKNGLMVRINKAEVRKEFYDHHHGGRDGAIIAATAYRDQVCAEHGIVLRKANQPTLNSVSRTKNGVLPGVFIQIDKGSPYFVAKRHNGTAWEKKLFNIKKLGYEAAFWAAVDFRLEASDLGIARSQITLQLPTMEEYVLLVGVCAGKPVPLPTPKVEIESDTPSPF